MKKQLRLLVIGAGVMGSYHARVVSQSERAKLSGIVEKNVDLGISLSAKFGVDWYESIPDLNPFDGVILAVPTEKHHELAQYILNQKVPLLIEKPITSDFAATLELINFSQQNRIPLMCGLLERFNPAFITASKLIKDPVHISSVRHSPYADRIKTGVSWDLLIHDVDLFCRLQPETEPKKVVGQLGYFHQNSIPNAEDTAECLITFANDNVAHASASRLGHKKIRSISITERNRLIEVDLLRKDVTIFKNVDDQIVDDVNRGYRQQTVIEIPEIISSQEPLAAQLERFIDLILGDVDQEKELQSLVAPHLIISQIHE